MRRSAGCCPGAPPRCRSMIRPGVWRVRARVERFIEPAILLLLAEGSTHGYELAAALTDLIPEGEVVDMGNLYRLLRGLEAEGLVDSVWSEEVPGPTKRVYELTEEGRHLLDDWSRSLESAYRTIGRFLERYEHYVRTKD